ncbi:MAG TPA: isoaspartyl peptidase/L-asparaginase, partial [Chitinophagaceae bacterium]|nr:isoaspartyl peptidase/L-asparaginase [Chitinophagaceae bacterium]
MRTIILLLSLFILNKSFAQLSENKLSDKYVLVIHGGAGTILKSQMTPEREKAYQLALEKALQTGNDILK